MGNYFGNEFQTGYRNWKLTQRRHLVKVILANKLSLWRNSKEKQTNKKQGRAHCLEQCQLRDGEENFENKLRLYQEIGTELRNNTNF